MAPPVDAVGPRPRLGDVEAPPRSRSSLSFVAEVESEPLGRARRRPSAKARAESEPWGRAKRSSSSSGAEPESEPWGRADRSSPSSGAKPKSEPWVGQSGVRRLPGLSPSPSPGSGTPTVGVSRPGGSLGRRVKCRRVPQPRWVGARRSAKGGRRRPERERERGGNPEAFVFVPRPGRVCLQ
jgi:hypothetical protein